MGQGEIKREHLRLSEADFPELESRTKQLMSVILNLFSCEPIQTIDWPYRYSLTKNQNKYEFIFSQMGSFTLRLAQSERYRRNPPPIFYMSIGKYAEKEFVWEDFNANPLSLLESDLVKVIEESIQHYENSVQEI
ncbi:MAG TPA: hypothetical protein PK079_20680 [Leptospiraceae bacterium]|nr:hypothetical protein [Leptospiraceae bacterium]HMW06376.1 hypothetical protein [Leptospiraceae bacterium]HMX31712.1 hypothetical protein [Leptospiraceae bacterium]HMY31998.1 hypothetical protein [Leptospiraceae bacterium]HMZ65789.1 hypothetical protein [Leptospiraceae bacterium]